MGEQEKKGCYRKSTPDVQRHRGRKEHGCVRALSDQYKVYVEGQ